MDEPVLKIRRKPGRKPKRPIDSEPNLTAEQVRAQMIEIAEMAQYEAQRIGVRDALAAVSSVPKGEQIEGSEDAARQRKLLRNMWERLETIVEELDFSKIHGSKTNDLLRMFTALVDGVAKIKGKGLIDDDPENLDKKSDDELMRIVGANGKVN